jgi:hypothetical protein
MLDLVQKVRDDYQTSDQQQVRIENENSTQTAALTPA